MVQAVNGVGLVSLDNNAGAFYGFGNQVAGARTATSVTLATHLPYGQVQRLDPRVGDAHGRKRRRR